MGVAGERLPRPLSNHACSLSPPKVVRAGRRSLEVAQRKLQGNRENRAATQKRMVKMGALCGVDVC